MVILRYMFTGYPQGNGLDHKNYNNFVHSGQSINDQYIRRNCGLLENFDKKLHKFYEDLQGKV